MTRVKNWTNNTNSESNLNVSTSAMGWGHLLRRNMKTKLYVSRLCVRGYDLVVVGHSKSENEKNLFIEAGKFQPQWTMPYVKEFYRDEMRTDVVEELGKVIYP